MVFFKCFNLVLYINYIISNYNYTDKLKRRQVILQVTYIENLKIVI